MDREQQEFLQGVEKAERLIDLLKKQERESNNPAAIVLIAV